MGSKFSDGVRRVSAGAWQARVTYVLRGKKHDTVRTVEASGKAEALVKRAALLAELSGQGGWTVDQALDAYLDTLRTNSRVVYESIARLIRPDYGDRAITAVTAQQWQRLIASTSSPNRGAQVRKCLVGMYEHAVGQGRCPKNTARDTARPKVRKTDAQLLAEEETPVRRAYVGDEPQRFLAAIDPDMRVMSAMELFLGCRFGEVSALEWRDIDMLTGVVRIRRSQVNGVVGVTKGKRSRTSAIGPHALAMLREHMERMLTVRWPGCDTLVFPAPPSQKRVNGTDYWRFNRVKMATIKAQKAIGADVASRTHAMRHTFVTIAEVQKALQADASFGASVRAMTGHASEAQAQAYVDARQLPASRIAEQIEKSIVGGGE